MKLKNTVKAVVGIATVTGATLAGKKISEKKFCPICSAKKMLNKVIVNEKVTEPYNNNVALTPPMGWSSWNLFRNKINEQLIKEIADAMDKSGLRQAGYRYVNIDDCWQGSERDKDGKLQWDKLTFPGGIKNLAEYVNSKGLKLGIYSSNGTLTCEDYPASLRNERIDAETFAEWGVEYFKYDFCHNVPIPFEAPKVIKVSVVNSDGETVVSFKANELNLQGMARVVNDADVEGGQYVDGIASRNGSFYIDVPSCQDEECYVLNVDFRKNGKEEKFLMVRVNGKDEYHMYFPGTKGWTPEGKAQTEIKLYKGSNHIEFSNPVGSKMDSAAIQYKLMGRELKRATAKYAKENGTDENPIVFSLCEWGLNRPWKWGGEAGNLWRTTPDIQAVWQSVLGIYEHNVKLYKYASKGAWNDPDMLEVGNGKLTFEENKSHFSLWCMMAAPLILGNDVRSFIKQDGTVDTENKIYSILTNEKMISINQDLLGVQCRRIKFGKIDVLVKPLQSNRIALCLFNKGNKQSDYVVSIDELSNLGFVNLPKKESYDILDVWEKQEIKQVKTIHATIMKHGVKVYIIE